MLKHFPRLTTITLSYVAAGLVFIFLGPKFFQTLIVPFGIIGVFAAGALYTYSFTTSIGALLLIALLPYHSVGVMAVVGGIGAAVADFTIFKLIRNDLKKEVDRIATSKLIQQIGCRGIFCKRWFRDLLGAIVIASPLPDEVGVAMMSTAKIKKETFILLTFIADVIGIYLLVNIFTTLY